MPIWTHSDPQGLQAQFEAALRRSSAHQWGEGPLEQRGAELRALTMGSVLTAYRALHPAAFAEPEVVVYDFPEIEKWPTVQHRNAAGRLLDTLVILADDQKPMNENFVTAGGMPPVNVLVEGWPILLARIAAQAIWAVAACYIAERYEPTLDRYLARKDAGDKMLAAQADVVKVVENHANEEVKRGQTLPYSDQENAVIDRLLGTQKQFAEKKDPPRPPMPHIGDGGTTLGLGALMALAAVAYFALKGK